MISILIPTCAEARNIADCIDSVSWSDDVVVVDSGSVDGTVEIAKAHGAKVVNFVWNHQFPKKKNWALENIPWKYDWVLIIDADERIPAELASEMRVKVMDDHADGYYINRKFLFLNRWIRHCGYYPSWNLRLFRHRLGRFEKIHVGDTGSGDNEVHEHVILDGRTAYLKNDMLHYAYPDIYTWMEKHNRYSNWEAQIETGGDAVIQGRVLRSAHRRLRDWSRKMPCRPALRFFYSFILQRGFLDGHRGFMFCRLLAVYEMLSVYKARELRWKQQDGRCPK